MLSKRKAAEKRGGPKLTISSNWLSSIMACMPIFSKANEVSEAQEAIEPASLLLKLPGEIRNRIYSYVLVGEGEINVRGEGAKEPTLLKVSLLLHCH
jgi:hypothetical protein